MITRAHFSPVVALNFKTKTILLEEGNSLRKATQCNNNGKLCSEMHNRAFEPAASLMKNRRYEQIMDGMDIPHTNHKLKVSFTCLGSIVPAASCCSS